MFMIPYEHHSCFWVPEVYAHELKSLKTFDNDMAKPRLFLSPNERVTSRNEYEIITECHMELSMYPTDVQSCSISFVSYKLSHFKLRFSRRYASLHKETGSDLTYDVIHSQSIDSEILRSYLSSNLTIQFILQRKLPLYVMATYFPSFLVTIVSFTSFWLKTDSVPGRVTLGVTSLLALITQMTYARNHIPNVNYVTAMDIWFLTCITFATLSLFEFAISYSNEIDKVTKFRHESPSNKTKTKILKRKLQSLSIDEWSRITFPSFFVIFSISYSLILVTFTRQKIHMYIGDN